MARTQIVIRQSGPAVYRRQQPLLKSYPSASSSSRGRIAEVAGGTTAECAAVWCCCPCTVVNLLVLAMYKLPAGICRKALRNRRRRQMIKKGLLPLPSSSSSSSHGSSCECSWGQDEFADFKDVDVILVGDNEMDEDLLEFEKEMWNKFYSTGFWRSPSQRSQ